MSKRLHIAITKTKLSSFGVQFPSDESEGQFPSVSISLELLTEHGFRVTSVNYNNACSWDKGQAFDLPTRAFEIIEELKGILHTVGEMKVQNVAALLEAPKENANVTA